MANYIITGRAALGKSAVAKELNSRNIKAFDTDAISELSSWRDIRTNEVVTLKDNRYVDLDTLRWVWDKEVLRTFLHHQDNIFVCGGADNDFTFDDLFHIHFVLNVTPDVQIERLQSRISNDYGKDPDMFPKIIEKQRVHIENAKLHNAIIIDAEQPIGAIVDSIMSYMQ
jgi:dephospho-CoA kinase